MEKRILNYRIYVDNLLQQDTADWEQALEEHLVQIGFFQHERLVHLIVTVIFALLTFLSITLTVVSSYTSVCNCMPALLLLDLLLLVLLVPYIRHYYILENETQKMYDQYDALLEKLGRHQEITP